MQGAPPAVTAGSGVSGSVQLETLNSLAGQPVSYAARSLPSYLSLSASGLLRWSSSAPAGLHSVTITPASRAATPATVIPASVTATLRVHGAIALSTANRSSTAGAAVWLRVTTSGPDQKAGFAPTLTAAGLPAGLSMTPAGVITGWAASPGTYKVAVRAADALGGTRSASFTWTVAAASDSGSAGQIRQFGGSGKCLDDPASRTVNGTRLDLWSCSGKSNQRWTAVQDGTLRTGGKCLSTAAGSRSNGARLVLETCNAQAGAQLWQAATDGQLVNPRSGKCLDVPAASAANGTPPVIEPCANSTSQPNEHWAPPGRRHRVRPARQVRRRLGHRGGAGQLREHRGAALAAGSGRHPAPEREMHAGRWNHGPFHTFGWLLLGGRGHQVEAGPGRPDRHRTGQHRIRPVRQRPRDRHPAGHRRLRQRPRNQLAPRITPGDGLGPEKSSSCVEPLEKVAEQVMLVSGVSRNGYSLMTAMRSRFLRSGSSVRRPMSSGSLVSRMTGRRCASATAARSASTVQR